MTVARIIPKRIRDQQDANLTLGAGTNGYGIAYNHTTGLFEMTALESTGVAAGLITAHVGLSNPHTQYTLASSFTTHQALTTAHGISAYGATLADDADATTARTTLGLGTIATQAEANYLLATGTRTGASSQAQTFTNSLVATAGMRPATDTTDYLFITQADGTTGIAWIDSTNRRLKFKHASVANTTMYIDDKGIYFSRASDGVMNSFLESNQGSNPFLTVQAAGSILLKPQGGSTTYTFSNSSLASPLGFVAENGTYNTSGNVAMLLNFDPAANVDQGCRVVRGTRSVTASNYIMAWFRGATEFARITWDGRFGIGTNSPTAFLDIAASTAAQSSLRIRNGTWPTTPNDGDIANNGNSIAMMVNGTNAVNTDGGLAVWMQSSTTARNVGRLLWQYTDKTDATRATRGSVTAFFTSTEHKPITWGANSGGALLSFYDVTTPIARQVLATGAGRTADDIITALQALGLVKQS